MLCSGANEIGEFGNEPNKRRLREEEKLKQYKEAAQGKRELRKRGAEAGGALRDEDLVDFGPLPGDEPPLPKGAVCSLGRICSPIKSTSTVYEYVCSQMCFKFADFGSVLMNEIAIYCTIVTYSYYSKSLWIFNIIYVVDVQLLIFRTLMACRKE